MAGRWVVRTMATVLLVSWGLLAAGCLPNGMPGFVDGGKAIVTVTHDALWLYEPAGGAVKSYALPHTDMQGKMMGGQIWVHESGSGTQLAQCNRFDWDKKAFVPGPAELPGDWVHDAVEGSWEGKRCLFLALKSAAKAGEKITYGVYSLPELKQVKTFEEAVPLVAAGDGWWVRRNDELFDAAGKSAIKLPEEFLKKVPINGPVYARMSADKDVLLLASIAQGGKTTFGMADVKTGKYLWGGECKSILGHPVITRDEGWLLTTSRDGEPTLVRYRKVEKAAGAPAGEAATFEPQKILEYGLGGSGSPIEYNVSPDGKEFVLMVDDEPPRLVFVPIRENVTAKDVRVVELKEKK